MKNDSHWACFYKQSMLKSSMFLTGYSVAIMVTYILKITMIGWLMGGHY